MNDTPKGTTTMTTTDTAKQVRCRRIAATWLTDGQAQLDRIAAADAARGHTADRNDLDLTTLVRDIAENADDLAGSLADNGLTNRWAAEFTSQIEGLLADAGLAVETSDCGRCVEVVDLLDPADQVIQVEDPGGLDAAVKIARLARRRLQTAAQFIERPDESHPHHAETLAASAEGMFLALRVIMGDGALDAVLGAAVVADLNAAGCDTYHAMFTQAAQGIRAGRYRYDE